MALSRLRVPDRPSVRTDPNTPSDGGSVNAFRATPGRVMLDVRRESPPFAVDLTVLSRIRTCTDTV